MLLSLFYDLKTKKTMDQIINTKEFSWFSRQVSEIWATGPTAKPPNCWKITTISVPVVATSFVRQFQQMKLGAPRDRQPPVYYSMKWFG
jgi:hypothetical protein